MAEKSRKQVITIVGAGNLGCSLARSLTRAGFRVDQIVARDRQESLHRARKLANQVGSTAVAIPRARITSDVIWFCVPDHSIAVTAESLSRSSQWKNKIAVHSSGALSSDELDVLRKQGAAVVAAHPLMTFVRGSRPALAGVPFGVEGDAKAVRTVRAIVRSLGGEPFAIPKSKKAAYHAWGMFTSPLLTALLVTAEEVAQRAGIGRKDARRRMLPILKQTLANYERLGAAGSFSGPIPRGDVATIAKHMRILAGKRELREVYLALARAALDLLPATKRAEMKKLLSR